jgi:hypothetical protein
MRDSSLDEFLNAGDDAAEDEFEGDDSEGDAGTPDPGEAAAVPEEREATEEGGVEATGGADDGDAADGGPDDGGTGAVEPAVSTYDWTPSGADCEACGAAVERRWRDDGRLVCGDCKPW